MKTEQLIALIMPKNAENIDCILTINTEVKMNKKDVATKSIPNPYLGAVKVSTMSVKANPQYKDEVNEALVAEGKEPSFEESSRKWGTNIGYGFVTKDDADYMNYIPVATIFTEYFFDGKPIEKEKLEPFMPVKKINEANQGLSKENTVAFRTVKVENIVSLKVVDAETA